jgi:hypothetical protein
MLCLTIIQAQASTPKRILFIGNSYTYVNDLPLLVSTIANSQGESIFYDSNTPGGYTLSGHCANATTLAKIAQGNWDYVVVQAQSQEPSFSPGQVASSVLPYAHILDSLIHVASPCAETVFYMTWGRKNGDASNCAAYPPVCTYAGMQSSLRSSYLLMAQQNNASVAPVGLAWREVINQNPSFDLYQSDQSHPSIYGSYLTACTFYSSFFQRKVIPNAATIAGISSADKLFLEQNSNQLVFDSLQTWYDSGNIPFISYSYQLLHDTIQFVNTSINATNYDWSFYGGTGQTNSTLQNPFIIYPTTTVDTIFARLFISNACKSDSIFDSVFVAPNSISEIGFQKTIKMYYQSNTQELTFLQATIPSEHFLELYSLEGKLIFGDKAKQTMKINLEKGVYLVSLINALNQRIFSAKLPVY